MKTVLTHTNWFSGSWRFVVAAVMLVAAQGCVAETVVEPDDMTEADAEISPLGAAQSGKITEADYTKALCECIDCSPSQPGTPSVVGIVNSATNSYKHIAKQAGCEDERLATLECFYEVVSNDCSDVDSVVSICYAEASAYSVCMGYSPP